MQKAAAKAQLKSGDSPESPVEVTEMRFRYKKETRKKLEKIDNLLEVLKKLQNEALKINNIERRDNTSLNIFEKIIALHQKKHDLLSTVQDIYMPVYENFPKEAVKLAKSKPVKAEKYQ